MMKLPESTLKLSPKTWMQRLAGGRLGLEVIAPGHGTYGGSHGAWGFSQRRVNSHIFYAMLKGCVRVRWSSGETVLEPGTAFWLSPRVLHDFELESADRPISLFHLRFDVIGTGGRPCRVKTDAHVLPHADRLRYLFEEIIAVEHSSELFQQERRCSLFVLLCSAFLATPSLKMDGRHLTARQRHLVERLVGQAGERFLSPVELANELDLSPEYFARLFSTTYGLKPRTWLVRQRIRRTAAALLETSASVAEIAARFGYSDAYFLSRQFRKVMGCSPRTFRQNQRTD